MTSPASHAVLDSTVERVENDVVVKHIEDNTVHRVWRTT